MALAAPCLTPGARYSTGDGIALSVSGDAPLSANARDALAALARAAYAQMERP